MQGDAEDLFLPGPSGLFGMMSDEALVFHMHVSFDKTFFIGVL
jgi:hypothetical protein